MSLSLESFLTVSSTGVLTGDDVLRLFQYAKDAGFAIPAFNVSSSSTVNAVLEAAAKTKNPIVVQVIRTPC